MSNRKRRVIVIAGNGSMPSGAANFIDAADCVIRFNDCRSMGAGGRRTDVVAVCNTGRPALSMLGRAGWSRNPGVVAAREIWCVRQPDMFEAKRPAIAENYPELEDFCDDYTAGFRAFATATGRKLRVVSDAVHAATDRHLSALAETPFVSPSSGLIVIADTVARAEKTDDEVVIAGFDHIGWPGHPFAAERRFTDHLIAAGKLRRLDAATQFNKHRKA